MFDAARVFVNLGNRDAQIVRAMIMIQIRFSYIFWVVDVGVVRCIILCDVNSIDMGRLPKHFMK